MQFGGVLAGFVLCVGITKQKTSHAYKKDPVARLCAIVLETHTHTHTQSMPRFFDEVLLIQTKRELLASVSGAFGGFLCNLRWQCLDPGCTQ